MQKMWGVLLMTDLEKEIYIAYAHAVIALEALGRK